MINQALSWALNFLSSLNKKVIDAAIFRQVPWSIVYRIKTKEEIYYLKLSHPIYSIEGKLLFFFQQHHFQHVPKIIAFNENLNAILLENAGENFHKLFDGQYQHSWIKKAIKYYAKLQINSTNYLNQLNLIVPESCHLKSFPSELENFLYHDADILLNDGVSHKDLRDFIRMIDKIEKLCQMLANFQIPNSIDHGDLFDENLLLSNRSLIINDWADAGLGHPFFSYGLFIHRLMSSYHIPYICQVGLKKTYLNSWQKYYSYQELKDILDLIMPLSNLRTLMSYARIAQINPQRKMTLYQGYLCQNLMLFIHDFKEI